MKQVAADARTESAEGSKRQRATDQPDTEGSKRQRATDQPDTSVPLASPKPPCGGGGASPAVHTCTFEGDGRFGIVWDSKRAGRVKDAKDAALALGVRSGYQLLTANGAAVGTDLTPSEFVDTVRALSRPCTLSFADAGTELFVEANPAVSMHFWHFMMGEFLPIVALLAERAEAAEQGQERGRPLTLHIRKQHVDFPLNSFYRYAPLRQLQ
jgi:hypothetical protein